MASNATIIANIKRRTKERGYTTTKLATNANIPLDTLQRALLNSVSLTNPQQVRIAKALNLRLADLTGTN